MAAPFCTDGEQRTGAWPRFGPARVLPVQCRPPEDHAMQVTSLGSPKTADM